VVLSLDLSLSLTHLFEVQLSLTVGIVPLNQKKTKLNAPYKGNFDQAASRANPGCFHFGGIHFYDIAIAPIIFPLQRLQCKNLRAEFHVYQLPAGGLKAIFVSSNDVCD
jgi:hypothetical protein